MTFLIELIEFSSMLRQEDLAGDFSNLSIDSDG